MQREQRMSRLEPESEHPSAQPLREWAKPKIELLPSPPPAQLRMEMEDEDVLDIGEEELDVVEEEIVPSSLTIKGAARPPSKRLSLLDRLAKAKAEAAALNGSVLTPINENTPVSPVLPPSISDPTSSRASVREAVHSRLRLRLKLESEKATMKHNMNESKAQELRRTLLKAKERRQAKETDATLRKMDQLERAMEVRRKLMVMKMMAAETEGERKERELKERLVAERRRKMLKEMLLARKKHSASAVVEPAAIAIQAGGS